MQGQARKRQNHSNTIRSILACATASCTALAQTWCKRLGKTQPCKQEQNWPQSTIDFCNFALRNLAANPEGNVHMKANTLATGGFWGGAPGEPLPLGLWRPKKHAIV